MKRLLTRILPLSISALVLCGAASSETLNLGYVAFDASNPSFAEVDISNETGPNSSLFPDTTFPVITPVLFTNLTLTVATFAGANPAPTQTFGPGSGYFTLAADGLSYNGDPLFPYESSSFSQTGDVSGVTLSGSVGTTILTLNDGSTVMIDPTFTASIFDSGGRLNDGDFALIQVNASPFSAVPEPAARSLGILGLALLLSRAAWPLGSRGIRSKGRVGLVWPLAALILLHTFVAFGASAAVHLNQWTSPDSGVAGSASVWVTGSGFPANIAKLSVNLELTCGDTAGPVNAVTGRVDALVGSAMKVQFVLPVSLEGTYFVQIAGTDSNGVPFSSDCAKVNIEPAAIKPTGCSLSSNILVATGGTPGNIPVTAYVPGAFTATEGVFLIPIEGPGTQKLFRTPTAESICVANGARAQVLCAVEAGGCGDPRPYMSPSCDWNDTFAVIQGESIVKMDGGAGTVANFVINPATNRAMINSLAFHFLTVPLQPTMNASWSVLDIDSNTFFAESTGPTISVFQQFPGFGLVFDPVTDQVLYPSLDNSFSTVLRLDQLLGSTSEVFPFTSVSSNPNGLSPIGEDCADRVAVSIVGKQQNQLYLTDLARTTYDAPGFWSAPSQTVSLPEFTYLSSGAMVTSNNHLGLLADEPGVNQFAAILLSLEGGLADYAVFQVNDGNSADQSIDAVNTYSSPNNGKDYAVVVLEPGGFGESYQGPFTLGVIDLKAALGAPRVTGTHLVQSGYNLVSNGVVRFIPVPAETTFP